MSSQVEEIVPLFNTNILLELPIEIIVHIMEYLSVSDKIRAAQVCSIWNEAANDFRISRKDVLILCHDVTHQLSVLENSNRLFLHCMFKEVDLNSKFANFWGKNCSQLQSLFLDGCNLNQKMFVNILSKCVSLKSLNLNDCHELLMSGQVLELNSDRVLLSKTLLKLEKLCLAYNRYLSDALFNRFVAIAPNLEDLSVTGCQVSFHAGLYKKFYPTNSVNGDMGSESVFTFKNILKYIASQSKKLHVLRFGHTLISNDALIELALLPGLCLEGIHLQYCHQLTNNSIVTLTLHQKNLVEINLSMCSRITDHSLIAICRNLSNLRILSLQRCGYITDIGVSELYLLKNLIDLDLAHCKNVTSKGIMKGLCSFINPKFQRFQFTSQKLDELCMHQLAECLPDLRYLDLSWCLDTITDITIASVIKHQAKLRTLKLAGSNVTDAGLMGFPVSKEILQDNAGPLGEAQWPDPMHKISLRSRAEQQIVNEAKQKDKVARLCQSPLLEANGIGDSLAKLAGLRELDLSGCSHITDLSLKYAFHFQELQYLNLDQCQQVTSVGLSYLAINNPSIETLILSKCCSITDVAVIYLAKGFPRLKHLDLLGCDQLTDESLLAIGHHCNNLRYLDVSYCGKMSLETIDALKRQLVTLHTLHKNAILLKGSDKGQPAPPPPFLPILL